MHVPNVLINQYCKSQITKCPPNTHMSLSRGMRFQTMWYVRTAKHMRSLIRAFASRLDILSVLSYDLNSIWSF